MTRTRGTRLGRATARAASRVHPSLGTIVMGSGIVSTALSLAGFVTLSDAVLALTVVFWAPLAIVLAGRLALRHRERLRREGTTPAALTGVAATAVLADRVLLLGWEPLAVALLVPAVALWLALLPPILAHWTLPTTGVSFLLSVSTLALALALATVARDGRPAWCLAAAAVLLVLGLIAYGVVLGRFERRQMLVGHGDHWVAGGALSLSALAAARLAEGVRSAGLPGSGLAVAALVLLLLGLAWLPVLVVCEVRAPRTAYHLGRWSTVFPLGMYAASSFVVGSVVGIGALSDFASVWTWVAFAAWAAVLAAMLVRAISPRPAERA